MDKTQDKMTVKGTHIFSVCNGISGRAKRLSDMLEDVRLRRITLFELYDGKPPVNAVHALWEEYNWYIEQLHKRFLVQQVVVENITTTAGRSLLAQRLAGNTTVSGVINYTALGDDATAENVGDTTLGNELYRKGLSSGTATSNTAYIETFFTTSEVTGDFEEYGNFIDGTGAADSGTMFNRFTETVSKSGAETLNVQSIITFNNA